MLRIIGLFYFIEKTNSCPDIIPPKNGLVVYHDVSVAQMKCKRNYYPDGSIEFFYLCNQAAKIWFSPSGTGQFPLPDCTST